MIIFYFKIIYIYKIVIFTVKITLLTIFIVKKRKNSVTVSIEAQSATHATHSKATNQVADGPPDRFIGPYII